MKESSATSSLPATKDLDNGNIISIVVDSFPLNVTRFKLIKRVRQSSRAICLQLRQQNRLGFG